jgi:hypothetical protein
LIPGCYTFGQFIKQLLITINNQRSNSAVKIVPSCLPSLFMAIVSPSAFGQAFQAAVQVVSVGYGFGNLNKLCHACKKTNWLQLQVVISARSSGKWLSTVFSDKTRSWLLNIAHIVCHYDLDSRDSYESKYWHGEHQSHA